MSKAKSYSLWFNRLGNMAICSSFLMFSCTRSAGKLIFDKEPGRSKVSTVTLSSPPILQNKIQSGSIDAVSIQITPGKCADGSEGTRVEKTIRKVSTQTLIKDIKLKSKCDYKIFLEIGKLDPTSQLMNQVFLTNIDNPTNLRAQDVEGDVVKTSAKLSLTPEGQSLLGGLISDIPVGPPSQPDTPQPITPQPDTTPPVTPQPIAPPSITPLPVTPQTDTTPPVTPQPIAPPSITPLPVTPQPIAPQPIAPQPSPQLTAGAVQLDSLIFTSPAGYNLAQAARDGDVRMATGSKDNLKFALFSRPGDCAIKYFMTGGAQTVTAEAPYQSRGGINWTTSTTKFSSKYTGKTVFSGVFTFVSGSGRCAFGYVTADSAETAAAEMKTVMDAITLNQ